MSFPSFHGVRTVCRKSKAIKPKKNAENPKTTKPTGRLTKMPKSKRSSSKIAYEFSIFFTEFAYTMYLDGESKKKEKCDPWATL